MAAPSGRTMGPEPSSKCPASRASTSLSRAASPSTSARSSERCALIELKSHALEARDGFDVFCKWDQVEGRQRAQAQLAAREQLLSVTQERLEPATHVDEARWWR